MSDQRIFSLPKIKLPYIGQRIIKTTFAVFLCLFIYFLRGYRGMVVQSAISTVLCMQPYRNSSKTFAVNRITGTLIGAFWGLLFLLFMSHAPALNTYMLLVYAVMSLGVLITLYSCVLIRKTDTASLAAVVFLCVVIYYPNVESPLLQAFDRVIDTCIGLLVALLVNSIQLPREKQPDKLIFIRMQDLVPDRYAHIPSGVLIALNHLFLQGASICLVSKWAPAFLISQMGMIKPTVPLIIMDGAALYDITEKSYLNVIPIEKKDADALCALLRSMDAGYCSFAIRDRTMIIYRQGNLSFAEDMEYETMKISPYRNYVDGDYFSEDQIAAIRTMDTDEKINLLAERLAEYLPAGKFRVARRTMPGFEGVSALYFYNPKATVENMKEQMLTHAREDGRPKERVDLISIDGTYRSDRDALTLLHRARDIYMPVKPAAVLGNLLKKTFHHLS